MAKLSPKNKKFCKEYLKDLNATQAAIRAGYSKKTSYSIGQRLLKNVEVQNNLSDMTAELAKREAITPEKVLAEYGKLAFSNMLNYITVHSDGYAYVDLSALTHDQAAALTEVTVEEYVEGSGDDARDVKKIKVKIASKKDALDSICKMLGFNAAQKLDHLNNGGSFSVSPEELEKSNKLAEALLQELKDGKK